MRFHQMEKGINRKFLDYTESLVEAQGLEPRTRGL